MLERIAFRPETREFNKMLNVCFGDMTKAQELWRFIKQTPGVHPNNISYRWELLHLHNIMYVDNIIEGPQACCDLRGIVKHPPGV